MSPEPTSVAALSRTSDYPHHNFLFSKEYNNYTKSIQSTTDKRMNTSSSSYLTILNNNSSTTSEVRESQDTHPIQFQRQGLNGNHNMNNIHDRLNTEIRFDKEPLDFVVAKTAALNITNVAESENQITGRLEQNRLEYERKSHERQIYEANMKMLKLHFREECDLLENHQPISTESTSAPNTPPSFITNDTRARSNTMPRLNTTTSEKITTNTNQLDSFQSGLLSQQRSNVSSRSVPNSRRNSNETPETPSYSGEEMLNKNDKISENIKKDFVRTSIGLQNTSQRKDSTSPNVSASNNDNSIFPQFNGDFLIEEGANPSMPPSSYVCRYTDDDKFPILVRCPGMLSASSAALDLALSPQSMRHRGFDSAVYYQKLSDAASCQLSHSNRDQLGPLLSEIQNSNKKTIQTPSSVNTSNGMTYASDKKKLDNLSINDDNTKPHRVHKLSTSCSTPELSSVNRSFGLRSINFSVNPASDLLLEADNQVNHSVQSQQNAGDNAGIVCRFYQQGYCQRGERCSYSHTHTFAGLGQSGMNLTNQMLGFQGVNYYGQYGLSGMGGGNTGYNYNQNLSMNANINNNMRLMHANNSKISQKRLSGDLEAVNRFAGIMLEELVGEIYSLCKDQHGCRYLQKKLEEKNEQYIGMIFNEVFSHFVELMTDPFGNYLCQKLLEYCNDDQRTIIIETVAPELVNISLNMHGTRAVQKMIEFLATPQQPHSNAYVIKNQIYMVIVALGPNVVDLIKDLNGNHVIQKCLKSLSSEDNQFIYDIVSDNCVEVATHRHGCCVLQRCIDHASEAQKIQLVTKITHHALILVQDPFGNYVVQYVLDLGDSRFTDSLIRKFIGNVCSLSKQKFSSNVIEKCIRVAEPETRKYMINELVNMNQLDKLLRDSYANYVVQTSLDYADPLQRAQLVQCIRPFLHAIRNTPYGKRIEAKFNREQQQMQALSSLNMLRFPLGNLTRSFGGGGIIDYVTPGFRYNY